ncbi:hypothetical protein P4641_20415 [Halalkalibacterium halodurans]|uniref:hypothetical protein n=1 Tax=Halalkalibacterium halodurans TaxID=86665 RepID=UPI002E207239|nr:hypothetical protein [Halalkalibacterium halodurans]
MSLFEGQKVTEVVTAKDIKRLTGITPDDFQFQDGDPSEKLDELLHEWIEGIASHVHVRLGRTVKQDEEGYLAIKDIIVRTVAKVVAVAQQQRSSPIIQTGDFVVSVLNTAEVTNDIKKELRPFLRKSRINVFSSAEPFKG